MPLHLIKLAVGAHSVKDLKDRIQARLKQVKTSPRRHIHVTRMTPKRIDDLLDGGSIYWVIKGEIAAREPLVGIEPFRDRDGIGRCRLIMQPKVVAVRPRPMRAFQGWRYLLPKDAPPDLRKGEAAFVAMPEELRRELRDLGLL